MWFLQAAGFIYIPLLLFWFNLKTFHFDPNFNLVLLQKQAQKVQNVKISGLFVSSVWNLFLTIR